MATTLNQATHDAQIDAILSVLSRHPTVRLAILFGSMASGSARTESDLDLAVDARQRLDAEEKIALISELAAEIGRPVDLVDLSAVGEPLLGQILKNGKKILGSTPTLLGSSADTYSTQPTFCHIAIVSSPSGGNRGSDNNRAQA